MSLKLYDFPMAAPGEEGSDFQCWAYINDKNEIYFRLRDFGVVLGYKRVTHAYDLVPDVWKHKWSELVEEPHRFTLPSNWQPDSLFISEMAVCALLARSRQPRAEKFMIFVYQKLLPTVRKTESYVSPNSQQAETTDLLLTLSKKDEQISRSLAMIEKNYKQLVVKDKKIFTLMKKIFEDRPKLAVMPERKEVRHELRIYRQKDSYKFIRTQKRNMSQAIQRVPRGYKMVLQRKDIPNGMNVLNRTKEIIERKEYKAKYNEITTRRDLEAIVRDKVLPPLFDEEVFM